MENSNFTPAATSPAPRPTTAPANVEFWTVFALQNFLRQITGRQILVALSANASTMLSVRRRNPITVRLNRIFLRAPEAVIRSLGDWLLGKMVPRRSDLVQEFINTHLAETAAPERRQRRLVTQGQVYDLATLAARVNQNYLADAKHPQGRSTAQITWGRQVRRRRARFMRLGYFDARARIIVISRRLDCAAVPAYFVEYVIFHEMLHEILGVDRRVNGRRKVHDRTFQLLEKTFPRYAEAAAFEQQLV
jgi:predicted metal-dependent hydrolase